MNEMTTFFIIWMNEIDSNLMRNCKMFYNFNRNFFSTLFDCWFIRSSNSKQILLVSIFIRILEVRHSFLASKFHQHKRTFKNESGLTKEFVFSTQDFKLTKNSRDSKLITVLRFKIDVRPLNLIVSTCINLPQYMRHSNVSF